MIGQILTDMRPFLLILGTGIFGFGFFFLIRDPAVFGYDHELVGPAWPFVSVFLLALGSFDASDYPDRLSMVVLLLALLFSTVLLLNLLIAIMGDSYEMVKESEIVEKLKGQALLVVEHERLYPSANAFPRYMHVLRAAEGGDGGEASAWEGIAGKVKQEVAGLRKTMATADELAEVEQKMTKKLEEVAKKLEALQKGQETLLAAIQAGGKGTKSPGSSAGNTM